MKKIIFLILNTLEKLGCLSYKKFQIPTEQFFNVYTSKAINSLRKQLERPRIESVKTVLFQHALIWSTELVIRYCGSDNLVFKYLVCQYGVNKYIIIECFGDEDPEILGCYEIPQNSISSKISGWVIVKVIHNWILQNSHYRVDPEVVIGYSKNEGYYEDLLKAQINFKREVQLRTHVTKGSRTIIFSQENSAGIVYPPKMTHYDGCPFYGQQIARHECLYCAQEIQHEHVQKFNPEFMTDFEFIDFVNRFIDEDLQEFKENDETLRKIWRELVRRAINYDILKENKFIKLKFRVRLQDKKLHRFVRE